MNQENAQIDENLFKQDESDSMEYGKIHFSTPQSFFSPFIVQMVNLSFRKFILSILCHFHHHHYYNPTTTIDT